MSKSKTKKGFLVIRLDRKTASNPASTAMTLSVLASSPHYKVRRDVARNPNSDRATLLHLFKEFPADVWANTAMSMTLLQEPGILATYTNAEIVGIFELGTRVPDKIAVLLRDIVAKREEARLAEQQAHRERVMAARRNAKKSSLDEALEGLSPASRRVIRFGIIYGNMGGGILSNPIASNMVPDDE